MSDSTFPSDLYRAAFLLAHHGLVEAAQGVRQAETHVADERAKIVAELRKRARQVSMLRSLAATNKAEALYDAADAIERGECEG